VSFDLNFATVRRPPTDRRFCLTCFTSASASIARAEVGNKSPVRLTGQSRPGFAFTFRTYGGEKTAESHVKHL